MTITSNRNQFGFILVEIYKNIDNSNERDNACCYLRRQFRWCWHPEYGQALLPRGMVPGNLELSTLSIYVPLDRDTVSVGAVCTWYDTAL